MTAEMTIGTRAQVWHGTAKKTSGGLTKKHLMMNKHGRIVSRRKHSIGKKTIKHLEKLGYKAKKGHFKLFHKSSKRSHKMRGGTGSPLEPGIINVPLERALIASGGKRRRSHKIRGGMPVGGPLSPHSFDGAGVGTSGVALQIIAGNAG
jgi:hypothetical protein